MRSIIMLAATLASMQVGCGTDETRLAPASNPAVRPVTAKKLYLDEHDLGGGKVTAADVAGAHAKDLATEAEYGVEFKAYWFDEQAGKVYCLAEAPSAEATTAVHSAAHGLIANKIMEVTEDNGSWQPTPGKQLFLDVHHFDPAQISAPDVARAHQRDLEAEGKYGVQYLDYWFDAATGTVMCLAQAPSADAALAVHREAHGLMPDSIAAVSEGR
jgi:hypothetical protein